MSLILRLRNLVIVVLLLAAACVHLLRLDTRALLWLQESSVSAEQRADELWLPGYRAVLQVAVPGFEQEEFSDLSYNPASNTLFTVSGKQPLLIELSVEGKLLRSIPVIGAANLEGVAVMEDGYLALTDERQQNLTIFHVDSSTRTLNTAQAAQQIALPPTQDANKGYEGLAWDKPNQRLLLGKEKYPPQLFSLAADGHKVTGELQALADLGNIIGDLSGLSVDPRSGQILALSQQSHLLLALNGQYQPRNFIALLRGLNGLEHYIPQAEGVAMDALGNLYMVSEHNLFYVFQRPSQSQ
ncbi:MAG: SdiA-regulated domain-containing protein [Pseudomonadaceae bacterium]|jgi:uncharacterized protein YjiK|nr:SdiA-regulated domain-containing protein [Pseudomonadaceae bacterium]